MCEWPRTGASKGELNAAERRGREERAHEHAARFAAVDAMHRSAEVLGRRPAKGAAALSISAAIYRSLTARNELTASERERLEAARKQIDEVLGTTPPPAPATESAARAEPFHGATSNYAVRR